MGLIMKLGFAERKEILERFRNRSGKELLELSVSLRKSKKYEKLEIIELIIKVKTQDKDSLKKLLKQFKKNSQWLEFNFVNEVLKEGPDTDWTVKMSPAVAKAMADRIKSDSRKHRQKT